MQREKIIHPQMASKIKVFHVEDYKIMRDGVRYLLHQDKDIEVIGEAKNGNELMHALKTVKKIDVMILDIYLDGMEDLKTMNGFQICHHLSASNPDIRILAHSVYDDADRVAGILKAGAFGFVSKKSGFEELIQGIKTVYRGQKFICSETSRRLKNLNRFLLGIENNLRSKDELFSQREREVLELLAEGKSSREIAASLFITERTVETHRKNMIVKGQVKNTVQLIAFASSMGLIKK
ncbi:MAG TPA: response regulator transcription factor [Cyclobacteriaceae bacterium]|nr:response regulator transcription factor [Cyclobacteriaceae bacterium]